MEQKINFNLKFENYESFKDFVTNNLQEFMPKDFMKDKIMAVITQKVNDKDEDIIVFANPSSLFFSNKKGGVMGIPMNEFYKMYTNKGLDGAIKYIIEVITVGSTFNKETILNKVKMRICNKNNFPIDMDIKSMPHREIFDLIIFYTITTHETKKECHMCPITNDMMNCFDILEKELFDVCIKRMNENIVIRTMTEDAKERVENMNTPLKHIAQGLLDTLATIASDNEFDKDILVVTNKDNFFGSVNIVNNKALKEIGDMLDSDFYIAFNNCNSFLCIPTDKMSAKKVKETNINSLDFMLSKNTDRFLSDNVYLFKRNENNLFLYTK